MRHRCGTACFVLFLLFGILLYLAELAFQVWVAVGLYSHNLLVWLALLVGFIIVPLLTSQLLSCQWAWPAAETKSGAASKCITLLPHLLCVAVPWRYCRLILTCGALDTKKELAQVCLLRVFIAFSSSLPILLLETYLILEGRKPPGAAPGAPAGTITAPGLDQYVTYGAIGVTLFSVCWALATHRKRTKDYHFLSTLISWPGTVFRVTWRFGELTSRLLILALFAGLHSFWILLVLALHWLTMFTWSLTEELIQAGSAAAASGSGVSAKAVKRSLMSSYVHVFCYLNLSGRRTRTQMVLFYVMICLENSVLLVLWFLYDTRTLLHVPMAVVIGASCVFAFISAVLYYNCFHAKSAQVVQRGAEVMYMQPCVSSDCCPDRSGRGMASQGGNFHPAWWIEVKENTGVNPNTYDMLLPSELKRNGVDSNKRGMPPPNCDQQVRSAEPQYWMDIRGIQTDVSSAVYESLSKYQQQQLQQERRKGVSKRSSGKQYNKGRHDADGLTWDNYNIEVLSSGHTNTCVDPLCQGQCLPQRPVHISDSGISATTSDQSGSRQRSDISVLYTSDTSDFTSTRTSLSYLDPSRIRHLSMYSDDWSLTSSSYGQTSSDSVRDIGMGRYLPMLTHLSSLAAEHRSAAPLPQDAGLSVSDVRPEVTVTTTSPDVHYDHVPSNRSQISNVERRRRAPKMGRSSYRTHRTANRKRTASTGGRTRKRAVPCGVAGKLHRRRHSDASDIRSRGSIATSTTDSYDGSTSDWDVSVSDRASSAQLPGTQSDLDFSVCGEYPFTETENEYVEPTSHRDLSHLPHILQKLDESGKQIGFVC